MRDLEHNIEDGALLAEIQQIERDCGGWLSITLEEIQTGRSVRYRPDEPCRTASIIKLPILVHVAMSVQEGDLDWSTPLLLTEAEKVGGSGVLTHLTAGAALTLRDICVLMTIISDNTATNMVIEALGVEPINLRMRSLGLQTTELFRKAFSPDTAASAVYGLGVTTASESCTLMAHLARAAASGDGAAQEALAILSEQIYRDGMPRMLPPDWRYAGKTGAINQVRNDVGLITAPGGAQTALAIFCQELPVVQWTPDNPALIAIARLSKLLLKV